MNMSLLILLLFSVSIFGFIFSAALLAKKKPSPYYFFTAVYLIFNISLFVNLLIVLGYIQAIPHIYRVISPFQFLFGPLCYFFVRTTLRPYQKFGKNDWWHFIPFLLSIIGLIPIFMLPADEKLRLLEIGKDFKTAWHLDDTFGWDYIVVLRIKFSIFLSYLIFQWSMIIRFMRNASRELRQKNRSLKRWLLFDVSVKTLIGWIVFISAWMENSANLASILQTGLIFIEIIGSAFFLIISPDLLKGLVFDHKTSETLRGDLNSMDKPPAMIAIEGEPKSVVKENDEVMLKVEQFLELEQPFLSPEFSLNDLSIALNISPRVLSNSIKSAFGIGFPEFVNKRRVSYLEQLIQTKPEMIHYSVDALAKAVGFNSRSGFYKAFKKIEGYDSPAQMIERIKRKTSSRK